MHPIAQLVMFYGEEDPSEWEYRQARHRKNNARYRRAQGKPLARVASSSTGAHTPPCTGCAFKQLCQERSLACNHFAEWSMSRREIPAGIKKLLPSKKWMDLMATTDSVSDLRVAYYSVIEKQTNQEK